MAAASATDAAIQKKSSTTALTISNEGMEDIIIMVKLLEESGLLIKGISETSKNEIKEQKVGFFPTLLGTLDSCILRNASLGRGIIRAGEEVIKLLIPPHSLTTFEILSKNNNFNGVYSRNTLSKIKDGAYIINLDQYEPIGTLG